MSRNQISGADFKAFYSDPQIWDHDGKPGWYVDDFLIRVQGHDNITMEDLHNRYGEQLEKLPDDVSISIESGYLGWQGQGSPPDYEEDLQRRFDQWLASRTFVTFVATVQVPKNNHEALARIHKDLEDLGAKVTRSDEPPTPVAGKSTPKP